jgi:cardiolipin synthase
MRIALVVVFLVVAEAERAAGAVGRAAGMGALAVFLAIGLSDLVDGWVARRFGLQSQAGAILDAFADKLAQVVVLAYLTLSSGPPFTSVPLWLLLVVVARDLLLGGSWLVTALQGRPVRVVHRPHGKIASTLLFSLLVGVLAGLGPRLVTPFAVVVAAVVIGSTVQYGREGLARLNPPGI